MKKIIALIKTSMTDNMSLFKIKKNNLSKKVIPIFLVIMIFSSIWSYANMIMEPLAKVHFEYVLLTLFVLLTSIMTLIEGIYKASNLLFNCKDDDLMFSLPIKKNTVLFIRILKFYIFELLYNTLFLLPAMVVYITNVKVSASFYLTSFIALLILPIIPIVISCIIGGIISLASSKFKLQNIAQIFITMIFLLAVLYISFNLQDIISNIAKNATSLNDIVTKVYYPAGAYIKLITEFNIKDLLIFVISHLSIFWIMIILLGKVYFKINSKVKTVKTSYISTSYKVQTNKPMIALIKKELNKFISSPVFVINAGFGLVLYLVGCIFISINFENTVQMLSKQGINLTIQNIKSYIPLIHFGLICFSSLMSSITSSMISLEGKTINILKSLPVKPYKIIISKVYTAVLIMLPFILIGNLIMFITFQFSIIEILMISISSIVLPLVSELIGIIVNLKYPKMNAANDTEVVKQSMSSMVAVLSGMILLSITIFLLVKAVQYNINMDLIILIALAFYIAVYIGLMIYLKKKSEKQFKLINV